jgi:glycopeptide antibiotics resistance protein
VPRHAIRDTVTLGWDRPALGLLAGNALVVAPFGALLPAVCPRAGRPRGMLLAGPALSASIELSQLAVSLVLDHRDARPTSTMCC